MGQGDRYALWPGAFIDGLFSITDELLVSLWREMVTKGKVRRLFYNGNVTDEASWIAWIKSSGNYPLLVVDKFSQRVVCVTWINNVADGAALIHFCILGLPRPEIGKAVLRYWSDVDVLYVLVGFIPETNREAVKYAKRIGFKESGYVPSMCNMVYKGSRVGAVITTYQTRNKEA